MKLTYKEILGLKGVKLVNTVTSSVNNEHTVTSVTKTNIVLDNGITIKTNLFYESIQEKYELVK